MNHFEPSNTLKELQQYYIEESDFDQLLVGLLLKYSTSEDNERYEEEYNSDDNYDSNYNMIDKPSIQEVDNQLKEYLHYNDSDDARDINEKILEMVIDVVGSNVIDSWLNDLKKLTNYDDIMSWDDEEDDNEDNNDEEDDNNEEDDDGWDGWEVITNEAHTFFDYPFYGCPILSFFDSEEDDKFFVTVLNETDGPFNSFKEMKLKFMVRGSERRVKRFDIPENRQQEFLQAVNKYCNILQTAVKNILNKDFESLFEKWNSLESGYRIKPFTEYVKNTYTRSLKSTYSEQSNKVINNILNVIICAICNDCLLVPPDERYKNVKLKDFLDSKTIDEQHKLYNQKAEHILNDIINKPAKISFYDGKLDFFGLYLKKEDFINYFKESDGTFEGFINTIDADNTKMEPTLTRIEHGGKYGYKGVPIDIREAVVHKFYKWIKKEASTKTESKGIKQESKTDEYFQLLDQLRQYYPGYNPPEKMGVKGLKNMLNYCKKTKRTTKQNNTTKNIVIKPNPVSKEYSDDPDVYEDIDNKPHISFDIQEKQDNK